MDLALVQCPKCEKVFQYYDYVSHQEICRNYESFTYKGARDSFLEKPYQNKGFKGAEAPSAEALADIDADDEYDDDENENRIGDGIGIGDGISIEDMYNPMFNRGFTNHRYSNMDDNMYNNMDTDMRDNSFENLLTNIGNLDIGLGRDNIEQYGCKITITEEIECSICLNNYEIGSEFYNMKCMHSFCKICAELWFESRSFCPLCKTNLKL